MSNFTNGKWEYAEYVPEDVTINGKEYIIFTESINDPQDEGDDIALARREADARLIAAAPEMYDAITECSDTLQAIKNANDCNEAVELYDVEELIHYLCELLARIDGDSQED